MHQGRRCTTNEPNDYDKVRDLISINERIQSARGQGHQLTEDEKGLIELCARELMSVSTNQNVFARGEHRVSKMGIHEDGS